MHDPSPLASPLQGPVLVSGASGFLGKAIVDELRTQGIEALGTGHRRAENGMLSCDLAQGRLDNLPREIGALIHAAAYVPPKEDEADPVAADAVNARGTLALLDRYPDQPRVLISSGTIEQNSTQYFESLDALTNRNFYEASKFGAELYTDAFAASRGAPTTILRCSYLYGRGMRSSTVVARLIERARSGGPLTLVEAGGRSFDFLHVRDAARAAVSAVVQRHEGRYFIGSGVATSVLDLARAICDVVEPAPEIEIRGQAPHDKLARPHDQQRIHQQLGWRPEISLHKGIRDLVEWIAEGADCAS